MEFSTRETGCALPNEYGTCRKVRFSDSGVRVSVFGFRVSGLRIQDSGFESWVPGAGSLGVDISMAKRGSQSHKPHIISGTKQGNPTHERWFTSELASSPAQI